MSKGIKILYIYTPQKACERRHTHPYIGQQSRIQQSHYSLIMKDYSNTSCRKRILSERWWYTPVFLKLDSTFAYSAGSEENRCSRSPRLTKSASLGTAQWVVCRPEMLANLADLWDKWTISPALSRWLNQNEPFLISSLEAGERVCLDSWHVI